MDFANLIKALETESEVYRQFVETGNRKTAVIGEGDIEKLDDILVAEQGLHMRAQNADKARLAILKQLGLEGKTLTDVIEISGGEQKSELMRLCGDLNESISEIQKINVYNTQLVKSRLEIISAVNNLYLDPETGTKAKRRTSASKGEAMYGRDAKVSQQEGDFGRTVIRKKL